MGMAEEWSIKETICSSWHSKTTQHTIVRADKKTRHSGINISCAYHKSIHFSQVTLTHTKCKLKLIAFNMW